MTDIGIGGDRFGLWTTEDSTYAWINGEDSDVYVIGTRDYLECFGAGWELERQLPVHAKVMRPSWDTLEYKGENIIVQLNEGHVTHTNWTTTSRQEMIDHLKVHRAMGHKVPKRAIKRLRSEIKEVGDTY